MAEVAGYRQREAYAAAENRSASLSQTATRFHLGQIWATNLRSMIQAEVVHRSLDKILIQAKVDLPSPSLFGATGGKPSERRQAKDAHHSADLSAEAQRAKVEGANGPGQNDWVLIRNSAISDRRPPKAST